MVLAVEVKAFGRKCEHQGLPFTHTLPGGELQHGRGRERGRQVEGRSQGHGGPISSSLRIKVHPERIWTRRPGFWVLKEVRTRGWTPGAQKQYKCFKRAWGPDWVSQGERVGRAPGSDFCVLGKISNRNWPLEPIKQVERSCGSCLKLRCCLVGLKRPEVAVWG